MRAGILVKIGLVWAIVSFLTGCAVIRGAINPIYEAINPTYEANIESYQYAMEIARLENIIAHNPEASERWQAHYQVAQLYISYKNPQRNYQKSLENLKLYLRYHPDSVHDHDLQNWLSVLNEIQNQTPKLEIQNRRIEQLNAMLTETREASLALKEENSILEKHNAELAQKIDMLKTLDHSVEEKRRNYSSE